MWRFCVLLLAVRTPAASACTSSSFNFFPTGTTNAPEGWTKRNQSLAGNQCEGQLLPIVTYGTPKPLLHFRPVHSLLTVAAALPAAYAPISDEEAVPRNLLAAGVPAGNSQVTDALVNSSWSVLTPADYTYTVAVNGKLWFTSPQAYAEGSKRHQQ
eukprot:GHRR01036717.1.p1 GENE.GHRR01036717.1~~GHRR01036717.1.p1  ORF type:complete len:156 (+),score=52.07 GHRR01036717.1:1658-2125(+)